VALGSSKRRRKRGEPDGGHGGAQWEEVLGFAGLPRLGILWRGKVEEVVVLGDIGREVHASCVFRPGRR
jgi:hypothetical protein